MPKSRHRFILLNGPARSGKDTMANLIQQRYRDKTFVAKLAWPLRRYMETLVPQAIDVEWFEENKDVVYPPVGLTPRNIMIEYYTEVAKQLGDVWLTEEFIKRIRFLNDRVVIITDCGRQCEGDRLSQLAGEQNVRVIRLHRDGCEFKDNRAYIESKNAYDVENVNNYPLGSATKIVELCMDWLED